MFCDHPAVIYLLLLADDSIGTTQAKVIQKEEDYKIREQSMYSKETQGERELVNTLLAILSVVGGVDEFKKSLQEAPWEVPAKKP